MRKLALSIVATLLMGIGSSAWAETIDFGDFGADYLTGGSLISDPTATIDDEWIFNLTEVVFMVISVDSNDAAPFFEISDFLVSSAAPEISFAFDPADNSYTFAGPLAAGLYTIDVSGLTTGSLGGQYEVLIATTVVPIPPAMLLFGSAILGFVAAGRRRAAA